MPSPDLVVRLDAWLPQTQCARCGYPNCRAYAEALAAGDTDINRCPPGGDVTLHALAKLLGVASKPQPGLIFGQDERAQRAGLQDRPAALASATAPGECRKHKCRVRQGRRQRPLLSAAVPDAALPPRPWGRTSCIHAVVVPIGETARSRLRRTGATHAGGD